MVARSLTAALAGAAALLTPALALACPVCSSRPSGGVGQWIVLGAFILLPYPLVGAVIKYIRSGETS
jgi:hypothetical protein